MSRVRVWAPKVKSVELVLERETVPERIALQPAEFGYFERPELRAGSEYRFSLDGGPPRPDPRSRWQPKGVHGPSKVFASEFAFTDAGFRAAPLAQAIMYELHVGTFAEDGSFDGVIARLPHLVDLGVTHVELMPIAEFPGKRGWGYDGVYPYAVHSGYGGPLAFKRLVNACHAHGLAVILDAVYNHFGPDGNYLAEFGPYFTENYHTPWGAALNLDGPESDHVRRYLIDNALQWFEEFHVDALRLDAVHALCDRSARHFLRQLSDETAELAERIGRPLKVIAESDLNDARVVRNAAVGGYGLDAQWSDDFHHALHVTLTGERNGIHGDFCGLTDLAKALEAGFVYDGRYSAFRRRTHGAPCVDVPSRKLVVCSQNHDQVGNRARGERISHLVGPKRARLGAALVLLGPCIPLLFQGEEWAASAPFLYFTDHQSEELARAVTTGRRREFEAFGWPEDAVPDPQAESTFRDSRLDFTELAQPPHAEMLELYRALIRLRHEHPELMRRGVSARPDERRGSLLLSDSRGYSLALNFGREPAEVTGSKCERPPRPLYASDGVVFNDDGVSLPAESFALWR